MTITADCELWLNGQRVPDRAAQLPTGTPTALSALVLQWGRGDSVSQPDTATCRFSLYDALGAESALGTVHVGMPVEVFATGLTQGGEPYYPDPDFEGLPLGPLAADRYQADAGMTATVIDSQPGRAVRISGNLKPGHVWLPPLPFSSNPAAWDDLPKISPGQTWTISITARVPAGTSATLTARTYTAPTAAAAEAPGIAVISAPIIGGSTGDPQTITGTVTLPAARPAPVWLALGLSVSLPDGPVWGVPVEVRRNLTPDPQGRAYWTVGNWGTGGAGTATLETSGGPVSGSYYRRMTWTTANTPGNAAYQSFGNGLFTPVTAGSVYTASLYARGSVGGQYKISMIGHTNAAGAGWIGVGAATFTGTSAWQRSSVTATIPATVTHVRVIMEAVGVLFPIGGTFDCGCAQVEKVSAIQPYFDGDYSPDALLLAPEWTDTPHASASILTQPNPAPPDGAGGIWTQHPETWETYSAADVYRLQAVTGGLTARRVLVFAGAVTDAIAAPVPDDLNAITLDVTAADLTADLGNDVIGDNPWPLEALGARAARIQAASRSQLPVTVDDSLAAIPVSWRDVDAVNVLDLLRDLAQTGGGALWPAAHITTGGYLWIEDTAQRTALLALGMVSGVITVVGATGRDIDVISACDVLREPVKLSQTVSEITTTVTVGWLDQTLDEDGLPAPTDMAYTVTDEAALARYGLRSLKVETELTSESDAAALANRTLSKSRAVTWKASGYALDTAVMPESVPSVSNAARMSTLMDLLDGTTRIGQALTLVDNPAWLPVEAGRAYVEGGSYSYQAGWWLLELTISPAGESGESAQWGQLPADWQWNEWAPELTWADIAGVGYDG